MEIIYRPAGPEDAAELKRLNDAFNGAGVKTADEMALELAAPLGERVFAAQLGERLVGFCCCQLKRSFCYETAAIEITELYVEPAFQRRGVGSGLLACAMESFREQPVEELTLLTGGDNHGARAFYERMGFRLSGEAHYKAENWNQGE